MNDSSTGGPLAPNTTPPAAVPATAAQLYAFLQGWIAPIIGLPGNRLRIYDQAEPPSLPDAGTPCAAIKVTIGASDTFPFVGHDFIAGVESDVLIRHETLHLLVSCYDLGALGVAQDLAIRLRDGLSIAQNREPLLAAGLAFVACDDVVYVPVMLKNQWLVRVDLPFRMRRQVVRSYPVLDLESAEIPVNTDNGLPPQSATTPPTPAQLDFSQPSNSQFEPNP